MVVYSSVCEQSVVAYLAYLSVESVRDVDAGRRVSEAGGGDDHTGGSRSIDGRGAVVDVFRCFYDTAKGGLDGVDVGVTSAGIRGYVGNVLGLEHGWIEERTAGVASLHDGSGDGALAGSVCSGDKVGSRDGTSSGAETGALPDVVASSVSEKTLANRRKRVRKAAAKERKRSGVSAPVTKESKVSAVSVEEELKPRSVPEWRRQDVRAKYHRGAFADCSADVQRELRESRAKMLVEKNKAAVVEAEHKRRTMEARLKTRIVEAEAEKKRLTLAAENKKLVEARLAALPRGYAETVVSMGLESVADVPSLSSGSVSPDSSISVAELDRMKAAMEKLITRVAELEVQAEDHANEKEAAKKQKQQRPVVRGMFEPTDYERERALYSRWD